MADGDTLHEPLLAHDDDDAGGGDNADASGGDARAPLQRWYAQLQQQPWFRRMRGALRGVEEVVNVTHFEELVPRPDLHGWTSMRTLTAFGRIAWAVGIFVAIFVQMLWPAFVGTAAMIVAALVAGGIEHAREEQQREQQALSDDAAAASSLLSSHSVSSHSSEQLRQRAAASHHADVLSAEYRAPAVPSVLLRGTGGIPTMSERSVYYDAASSMGASGHAINNNNANNTTMGGMSSSSSSSSLPPLAHAGIHHAHDSPFVVDAQHALPAQHAYYAEHTNAPSAAQLPQPRIPPPAPLRNDEQALRALEYEAYVRNTVPSRDVTAGDIARSAHYVAAARRAAAPADAVPLAGAAIDALPSSTPSTAGALGCGAARDAPLGKLPTPAAHNNWCDVDARYRWYNTHPVRVALTDDPLTATAGTRTGLGPTSPVTGPPVPLQPPVPLPLPQPAAAAAVALDHGGAGVAATSSSCGTCAGEGALDAAYAQRSVVPNLPHPGEYAGTAQNEQLYDGRPRPHLTAQTRVRRPIDPTARFMHQCYQDTGDLFFKTMIEERVPPPTVNPNDSRTRRKAEADAEQLRAWRGYWWSNGP